MSYGISATMRVVRTGSLLAKDPSGARRRPTKDSQTKKGNMRGKDRIATVPKKVERVLENK